MNLNKGEMICPECNGNKTITEKYNNEYQIEYTKVCRKCSGFGKVDWLENILDSDIKKKLNLNIYVKNISRELVKVLDKYLKPGEIITYTDSFDLTSLFENWDICLLQRNNKIKLYEDGTSFKFRLIMKNFGCYGGKNGIK